MGTFSALFSKSQGWSAQPNLDNLINGSKGMQVAPKKKSSSLVKSIPTTQNILV